MELRVLNYFLAVVREGNITAAARTLHVSQPTLSRQLMDLEEELGQILLIRGNRRVELTDEGALFRKRAEEITSLVEKTKSELSAEELISGDIYIGAAETKGIKIIADAVKDLRDEGFDVRCHITSGNAADVAERLDKGLLDFGLLLGNSEPHKYHSLRLPTRNRWGLLVKKDSPLAERDEIEINELPTMPLIVSKQALENNEFSGHLGVSPDKLKITATYNLLYNASVMAEEGLGCVLCIEGIINTTGNSDLCFIPLNPRLYTYMDLVWKRYQVFSKPAELFLEKMRKAVRNTSHYGTSKVRENTGL